MRNTLRHGAVGMLAALLLAMPAHAEPAAQERFASADDAVAALILALRANDVAALGRVLGPGSEQLVTSGDKIADANGRQDFLERFDARHGLVPAGADRMVLDIGADDWPMPIPIVQDGGHWRFDSKQGAQEIVDRRIGRNEIATIRTLLALVDAQQAFNKSFGHYAQHVLSTPGQRDGLYWAATADETASPLAALLEQAEEEGYPGQRIDGKPLPYHGYYYRLLQAQGPAASGGAVRSVNGGQMTGGFGYIAWPAVFGASGIMTFIVNQDGVVFQQDLGAQTAERAGAITQFDPDLHWAKIDISEP